MYDQIMLDAEDNLEITNDLLKNRDVDSLVAAQLMTSLARGDLVFDQHNTVPPFQNGQATYHDMDALQGTLGQNNNYPLPDQNNNMYGVNNYQDLQRNPMIPGNMSGYDNLNQLSSYYQGPQGVNAGVDPRRHSFPGGDVGSGYGFPQNGEMTPVRRQSDPGGLMDGMHNGYGPMAAPRQQMNGNPNLVHPQPCYPNGSNYQSESAYYNEPFVPIGTSIQNGTMQTPIGGQGYGVTSANAATQVTEMSDLSDDSDDSDYEPEPFPKKPRAKRSLPLDKELEESIQSIIPTKRRKKGRSTRTSYKIGEGYNTIIDNLYLNERIEAAQERKKRKKRSGEKAENFFMVVSPDINPKEVESIDHKGLIAKYIDYLLIENEQITEMSKSVSIPIENCVMDDPYLMDIIKVKIPFPTPKYLQWLRVYYPTIQVDWDAVNQELSTYIPDKNGQKKRTYYLDNRASPVLLGESFYFFQREKDRTAVAAAAAASGKAG